MILFFFSFYVFILVALYFIFFIFFGRSELEAETTGKIPLWNENKRNTIEMTWCSNNSVYERAIQLATSSSKEDAFVEAETNEIRRITCPSCGHNFEFQDQVYSICCCVELTVVTL
jgi:flagellar basal body-associated protein FliL